MGPQNPFQQMLRRPSKDKSPALGRRHHFNPLRMPPLLKRRLAPDHERKRAAACH